MLAFGSMICPTNSSVRHCLLSPLSMYTRKPPKGYNLTRVFLTKTHTYIFKLKFEMFMKCKLIHHCKLTHGERCTFPAKFDCTLPAVLDVSKDGFPLSFSHVDILFPMMDIEITSKLNIVVMDSAPAILFQPTVSSLKIKLFL